MKKIISSLLALSLIVGSSFNSMSLSALADSSIKVQNVAETQAKSPQKTLPLSPEGQAALDTFYANQSYPKVDFISWNDWIPSGSELESIRIYRSESPFHGSYNDAQECYLINDADTIQKICEALRNTNGSHTTNLVEVTGYDTAEYSRKYSIELSYGKSYMRWDFPENFENFMIFVPSDDLAYSDIPYLVENRKALTDLLQQLTEGKPSSLFDFIGEHPDIKRIDKQAHTYTSIADASKTDIEKIYAAWNSIQPTQRLSNLSTPINQNLYYSLSDGTYRLSLTPTDLGGNCTVDGFDGFSAYKQAYQFTNDDFYTQVERCLTKLPEHPSWLHTLANDPKIEVTVSSDSGYSSIRTIRTAFVQDLLPQITVKHGSFKKASKKQVLKNPLSFTLKSRSNYTIQMTDTQLLIHNDSVSYGALYQLENGKQTKAAFEKALNPFDAKQYADAYTEMILQLIKDDSFYFEDRTEMTIDLQNFPENSSLRDNVCKQIQQNLAKKGYSFTVYAGDFDQLIERGVWDKDVGGYQNGVLVEIDDKWNSNTSVSYIIGATVGNLAAVYYPENQAVFQNGSWQITPSEVVAMA